MAAQNPIRSAVPGNPTFGPPLSPESQADLAELRSGLLSAPSKRVILVTNAITLATAIFATMIAIIAAIRVY